MNGVPQDVPEDAYPDDLIDEPAEARTDEEEVNQRHALQVQSRK
jgi:hypothetical protein